MRRGRFLVILSLLCGILPSPVRSQGSVRTRELSPAEVTSAGSFGPNASVRALSDGRVVLHDHRERGPLAQLGEHRRDQLAGGARALHEDDEAFGQRRGGGHPGSSRRTSIMRENGATGLL